MTNSSTRLLNIGLRGSTLATRFIFVFFLAKYLDPASVGYYGLFTATIGYVLFVVGLDFYTYLTREIIKTPSSEHGRLLKGQAALSGLIYLFVLPPVYVVLYFYSGWPNYLLFWFFPILLLEHFNQEMSRLLIALSQQITASIILFFRQGSWALAIVGLMFWEPSSRHLSVVMGLWATAGIGAALVAVHKLRKLEMGGWQLSLDWKWIKRGIGVSSAFLAATLALKGFQTLDRYWLEALGGIEIVGAYVLFVGVAGTLLTFLDAAVFSFSYPALIKIYQKNGFSALHSNVIKMIIITIVSSAFFSLVSWLLLPYLLTWIGKQVYLDAIQLYPWILFAMIINALGLIPHYALYAAGRDRPIIQSHFVSLIVFIGTVWLLSTNYGALSVPLGLIASFSLILLWKSFSYWQVAQADIAAKPVSQTIYLE